MKHNAMVHDDGVTVVGGRQRWAILGIAYLCSLAFAITLQSVAPILSLVMAELNLSYTQGGLLMSAFALPGMIIAIPAGMLADRYNQKVIGVVAHALMIAGAAIFASGSSLPLLALGRAFCGIGAVTLAVLVVQSLAQWFAGRDIGTAMGVFNTGVPVGTIISLNLLSFVGENLGWRVSIWICAGISLLAMVIFALLYSPAPVRSRRISPTSESFFRSIMQIGTPMWMVGFAWMFLNASHLTFITFTPDFLKSAGISITTAGFYTSLAMWPALVVCPLVGYIIDRIDRKRTIIAISGLGLAILMVWTPEAIGWMPIFIILIGIVASAVPPPIFALSSEVASLERWGVGYGILSACVNTGILFGPATAGLIRDVTGSYQASYALMSGFGLMIAIAIIFSRRRN